MRTPSGVFYYPVPGNKRIRMYVRERDGVVEFRLYNPDYPEIWERHGWLDMDLVQRGAQLFRKERSKDLDPARLYDLKVAKALLEEERRRTGDRS
ncbi:MAG: hypothetical protein WHT64_01580 [Desulfomicrobiaceae bacterium]